jgi:hypothetical protein
VNGGMRGESRVGSCSGAIRSGDCLVRLIMKV